ncbi:MAG: protein-disulfide reductase DsbD family protein [Roseovarius sp.]
MALLLALAAAPAARAASDLVAVRVLEGWRGADGAHMAALELRLKPGWKTYWRAPGDAGIPPSFDWRRSRNVAAIDVLWPAPSVSVKSGVRTIGYADVLVLPLSVAPARAGADVTLAGSMDIGVCSDVCVPVTLHFSSDLPQAASKRDPRIAAALASRPLTAAEAGVGRVACRLSPIDGGLALRAEIDMPPAGGRELALVEVDDPQIWVAQPKTAREGGRLVAETSLYHVEGRSFLLNRSGIRITVLGQSRAVDIQGCTAG